MIKKMTKLVVLDAYALTQGDNRPLETLLGRYGTPYIYDRTAPEEVLARAKEADFLFTNKTVIDAATIEAADHLKMIGVLATGYNVVDIGAARAKGIPVTNIPAYSTESVGQLVFAHLLNIMARTDQYAHEVREGQWSAQPDFSYRQGPIVELYGKTLGLVGFGHIGQAVARIALAFGMKVKVVTRKAPEELPQGVERASLEEVFSDSDAVSLHCPLTTDNVRMVDTRLLGLMKRSAVFINTARGGLVDEAALADALAGGRIRAAGLDVLAVEPPAADCPLLRLENCFITPHIAWATEEAIGRLMQILDDNIRSVIKNTPINNVAK